MPEVGEMIWVLLAALGVTHLVGRGRTLLGALEPSPGSSNARRVPVQTPDAVAGDVGGNWSRGTACARWVHNVLIVNRGLALAHDPCPARA